MKMVWYWPWGRIKELEKKFAEERREFERRLERAADVISHDKANFIKAFKDVSNQVDSLDAQVKYLEKENTDLNVEKTAGEEEIKRLEGRVKEYETNFEMKKEEAAKTYVDQVLGLFKYYVDDHRCTKKGAGECIGIAKDLIKDDLKKVQNFFQYCLEVEKKACGTSYGIISDMISSKLSSEEKLKMMEYFAQADNKIFKELTREMERVGLKKFYQERVKDKV